MKVDLKGFKGVEEALVELEQITGKTTTGRNALTRAGTKALGRLRERMAALAPYDAQDRDGDGNHLRDTMRTQAAKAKLARAMGVDRKSGVVLLTGPAPVGKRARSNAGWQEYGTVKMPAKSYIRSAADAEGDRVVDELEGLIAQEIEAAKARIARKAARRG